MKKTIFITSASSGFGKTTVKLFHEKGWNVVATVRAPEKEQELAALSDVLVVRVDLMQKETIGAAVEAGIKRFGAIDVLVNNAGYGSLGAWEVASEETIRRQFEVNVFGLIGLMKAVVPGMRARGSGVIVNVSSVGGKATFPFSSLYHATKFAVEGLTESLQYELNPAGIRLKIVEPGGYKTDFAGRSYDTFGGGDIAVYQKPYDAFLARLAQWPMSENIGEVAEMIYIAATDGTEQLRYPVGRDAGQLLEARHQMDDIAFKNMMAEQTGVK